MHQKTKDIQKRYDGFLQTNCLWKDCKVFNLKQFKIVNASSKINIEIDDKIRLGKYIERFVSYQIQQEKNTKILSENIQIQKDKITLGELDCIFIRDEKPIHLEIIYKFYLFDVSVGKSEIEHFIGPNRKDSLIDKLNKLKKKQLPLLYSKECSEYLKSINLKAAKIKQQVYFKAQLFVPFTNQNIELKELNTNCIVGFYIHQNELDYFVGCKFFIPNKKDWLIVPHKNVDWLHFEHFKLTSKEFLNRKFSPLCWVKLKNGELKKIFLVWW